MTEKKFFKLLKKAAKKYPFELVETSVLVRFGKGKKTTPAFAIKHKTDRNSFWSPVEVVAKYLDLGPKGAWLQFYQAAEALGLSEYQYKNLVLACGEKPKHRPIWRKKLMKACKLKEPAMKGRKIFSAKGKFKKIFDDKNRRFEL